MEHTHPGIVRMLWRLAGEQAQAAYEAVRDGAPSAAELTAQAAETYRAAKDPTVQVRGWTELCPPCQATFYAWRGAPNPDDLSHLPPQVVALVSGGVYDQQVRDRTWRDTQSYQQLLTRALCTAGRHSEKKEAAA
jgi:hypothetical protein